MATALVTAVLNAPADAVWERLADFTSWHTWLPRIASTTMDPGTEDGQVGSIRTVHLSDGSTLRERLIAKDQLSRTFAYDFPDGSPFSVRRYVAHVRVEELATTGDTSVCWSGDFDADESDEARMVATFRRLYLSFLEALAAALRSESCP